MLIKQWVFLIIIFKYYFLYCYLSLYRNHFKYFHYVFILRSSFFFVYLYLQAKEKAYSNWGVPKIGKSVDKIRSDNIKERTDETDLRRSIVSTILFLVCFIILLLFLHMRLEFFLLIYLQKILLLLYLSHFSHNYTIAILTNFLLMLCR